jgi:hypothetical protein
MKNIRKYLAGLAVAGFVMAVPTSSHASFVSKSTTTITASAPVGGAATVAITSVAILNRSNNAPTTGIAWTGATPGAGWLVADQYVQMVTNINTTNGGVQIYTDNTNATGVSKFTGSVSSFTATPAGLVDNADGTQKLPTAWMASTSTLTSVTGVDPNANSGQSFAWFFHEDKAQIAVPSLNASVFGNGDPFITVYAAPGTPLFSQATSTTYTTTSIASGLHFNQGPTQFGGFATNATTNIYTEADFVGALAQTTYSTTRLILEAFSL